MLLRLILLYTSVCVSFHIPQHTDWKVSYWKIIEIDESCLELVPHMPGTTVKEYPVLSRNVPLGTRTYYTLEQEYNVTAPTGIGPGAYGTPDRQGSRDASTPYGNTWWPPGRIQVCGRATL